MCKLQHFLQTCASKSLFSVVLDLVSFISGMRDSSSYCMLPDECGKDRENDGRQCGCSTTSTSVNTLLCGLSQQAALIVSAFGNTSSRKSKEAKAAISLLRRSEEAAAPPEAVRLSN